MFNYTKAISTPRQGGETGSPRMPLSVYVTGFTMGLSLIVAIGAQNSFVLRQGLRNEHVFAVCLTCALSDAVLILAGVVGLKQATAMLPMASVSTSHRPLSPHINPTGTTSGMSGAS